MVGFNARESYIRPFLGLLLLLNDPLNLPILQFYQLSILRSQLIFKGLVLLSLNFITPLQVFQRLSVLVDEVSQLF